MTKQTDVIDFQNLIWIFWVSCQTYNIDSSQQMLLFDSLFDLVSLFNHKSIFMDCLITKPS